MSVKIYHNPRCSKSRQTLEIVNNNTNDVEIIEYLKNPPTKDQLANIIKLLKILPRDLLRTKEAAYQENGLNDNTLSDDDIISKMVANPVLIERPIVINGNKAAIGRPPENVIEIL